MTRISTLLSPLLLIGIFRLTFGTLLPPDLFNAAPQPGYQLNSHPEAPSLRSSLIKWVLDSYGVGYVSDAQMAYITVAVLVYSAIFGYLSDTGIRERGFGPSLNGIICFVGACLGLVGCVRLHLTFPAGQFALIVVVVVLTSTALLLAMAIAKTWIMLSVDRFLAGGQAVSSRKLAAGKSLAAERLAAIGGKGRR